MLTKNDFKMSLLSSAVQIWISKVCWKTKWCQMTTKWVESGQHKVTLCGACFNNDVLGSTLRTPSSLWWRNTLRVWKKSSPNERTKWSDRSARPTSCFIDYYPRTYVRSPLTTIVSCAILVSFRDRRNKNGTDLNVSKYKAVDIEILYSCKRIVVVLSNMRIE